VKKTNSLNRGVTAGWTLLIAAAGVRAQIEFGDMNWEGMGGPVIIAVMSGFLGAVIIFLAYYYYKRMREGHDEAVVLENRFHEAAERSGLTGAQSKRMRELVRHDPGVQPHVIFQSIVVFEQCVNREISEIIKRTSNPEVWKSEDEQVAGLRKKCGYSHLPIEHPLVSTRNMIIGQRGQVFGSNFKIPIIQKAAVKQSSEFTFELHYDAAREDVPRLAPNEEIKFVFSRQNDGLYGIQLTVKRADGDGIIEVYHTVNMRRNQLRQYVRVDVNLPMKLRLIRTADPASSQIALGATIDTRMADISGGGVSFLGDQSLRPGDIVSVSFSLPNYSFTTVSSKILRVSLQEGKTRTLYRHHTQFLNMEAAKRDTIIRFVFEKLRLASQWS
jgi:hypothetical protein